MKNLMILIVFLLTLGSQAIAAPFSALQLKTTSEIPIKVVLNGQLVSEYSNQASINNVFAGHHHLEVYYNIQDYYGVREEILFRGKVFLPSRTNTFALINENGQFIIEKQIAMLGRPGYHVQEHNYTYHPHQNQHNGVYGTKPIFWNSNHVQTTQCGTPPANIYTSEPVIELFPMRNQEFSMLKSAINNQWFSEGKMNVLNQALANNYFTALQVKELISLFSFSSDRLAVAKNAYHKTLDQENYFVVNDALQWNSAIQNLSNYIASL